MHKNSNTKPYYMFLDDLRGLDDVKNLPRRHEPGLWVIVRNSADAMHYVKYYGLPEFFSFDHDLGGDDTTMVFLRMLEEWFYEQGDDFPKCPAYQVHSSNPAGAMNIVSFMNSWKKIAG